MTTDGDYFRQFGLSQEQAIGYARTFGPNEFESGGMLMAAVVLYQIATSVRNPVNHPFNLIPMPHQRLGGQPGFIGPGVVYYAC